MNHRQEISFHHQLDNGMDCQLIVLRLLFVIMKRTRGGIRKKIIEKKISNQKYQIYKGLMTCVKIIEKKL